MTHYDLLIIGFGKAGKTLAKFAANQGQRVAVVEQSANMYQHWLYSYKDTHS